MGVEQRDQDGTMPRRLTAGLLMTALLAGALGGVAASQLGQGWMGIGADSRAQPPLIMLSVAEAVMAGRDAREIRALAERFADAGFVVLDGQAVLAAPAELYLPLSKGVGR